MSTEDIAAIGLGLETDGIEKGIKALDVLASKGPAVEKSMAGVEGSAARVNKSLATLGQGGAAGGLNKVGDAAGGAAREMGRVSDASDDASKGFAGVTANANLAAKAIASIGIAASIQKYLSAADAVTTLNNSLKLSTGSTQAAAAAYEDLFQIAQRSRVGFLQLGETYSSISRATGELGISQSRMLKVTESIANAMTIGGGSAQGMNAALVQLSQGMASGTLRGEELNSILEQAPRLAKALADGLGVPIGKLREMGQAGEITSQQIVKALESQSAVLSKEVTGATLTLGQAFTQLTNSGTKAVGEFDRASGASTSLAQAISSIASAMDGMGTAFQNNETIIKTVMGSLAGAAALTTLAAVPRAIAAIGVAVTGLSAVLAANPIVLTLLGVGAVVGGSVAAVNAYSKTADGIKSAVRSLEEANTRSEVAMQRATAGGRVAGADNIRKTIEERQKAIRELNAELALMSNAGLDNRAEEARLAAGTEQMRAQQRAAEELTGIKQKLSGVDKDYLPTLNKLFAQYQSGALSLKEYQDLVSKLAQSNYKPDKVADGVKATQSAYDALIASIRGKIEADKLELAGGVALTESQRLRIKLDEDLSAGRIKLGSAQALAVRMALDELTATEASVVAAKTLAKANLDAAASREKYLASLETGITKIQADIAAQQEATARMGLTKDAIAALDGAKLEMLATDLELQAIKALDRNLDQQTYDALKTQAQLYRDLAVAKKGGAAKETALDLEKANKDAAKKAQEEWERAAEDINRSLTDALLRGFESGKDFAKNLRDTVVNMFKTMVLRPVISAVMAPIAGGIQGMMGGMAGGGGGGSGIMGMASNASSLYSAVSGNGIIGNAASTVGGWLGFGGAAASGLGLSAAAGAGTTLAAAGSGLGLAGSAAGAGYGLTAAGTGLGLSAGSAGAGAIGAGLGTSAAAGGTAAAGAGGISGALAAIPVWGWALAAVAVLGSMLSKKQTLHSGAGAIYNSDTGVQEGAGIYNLGTFGMGDVREYNKDGQALASGIAAGLGSTLDGIAKAFGQKAGYEVATAFADDTSKDGAWGALRISKDGKDLLNWEDTRTSRWAPKEFADGEAGQKEYLAEIAKDTRQVLLDMDLPSWADTMLESIGEAASMDQLAATVQQIGVIQTTFVQLGKTMEGFAGLTDQAFEALMRASGGFEALSANAATYYENFYSDAEKTAAVTRSVSESLAQVGLAMPATRDEFRTLVESQLALGESGAEAAAALLGVSGAFASVTSAAQDAAAAEARAAESQYAEQMRQVADAANERQRITDALLGERSDAEIELLRAQGKEEAALAAERARSIVGYDAYQVSLYDGTQAIFRQIEALQLAAEEMDRMAEVSRTLAQELPGVLSKFLNPEQRLSAGYNSIASDLSKVGFKVDPGVLATASMQQIAAVTMELYNLGTTSDEVRLALVRAAGGLADLKAEATNLAVSRTDAAMSALERAAQAQREVLQETITDVRAVFDAAASGVKALRGQVDAAVQMSGAQGQAFIANALGNARTTGYLPDGKELQDAIGAVTAGFDSAIFTTQADADYQRLVVAGNLEALQGIGGEQLTEAEKALDSLDAQLETAREQLDALRGIQGGVLSMADALAQFSTALARESAVRGGGGGNGAPAVALPGYLQGANGASYYVKQDMGYQAGTGLPWMGADVRDAARQLLEAGNARGIYDGIKASGFSLAQADTILGLPAGEAEEWARSVGLPVFHDGTNYVPRTGFALLEQGEAVVPRAFNPSALGGGNTERLERLVEGLTTEVQRLQAVVAEGNGHQESTAKALGSVVVNNTLITAAAPEF